MCLFLLLYIRQVMVSVWLLYIHTQSVFYFLLFLGTYILQLSSYPFQNVFCLFPHFLMKVFLIALNLGVHIASIIPSMALALMTAMQSDCEWTAVHSFGRVQSRPCWSQWGFCLWLPWGLTFGLCLKWVSESSWWQQLKPRDLTKCVCKVGMAVSSAYVTRQVNISCRCPMVVTYTCLQMQDLFINWQQCYKLSLHLNILPIFVSSFLSYLGLIFSSQNLGIEKWVKVLNLGLFCYLIVMKTYVFLKINVWVSLAAQRTLNVCLMSIRKIQI